MFLYDSTDDATDAGASSIPGPQGCFNPINPLVIFLQATKTFVPTEPFPQNPPGGHCTF